MCLHSILAAEADFIVDYKLEQEVDDHSYQSKSDRVAPPDWTESPLDHFEGNTSKGYNKELEDENCDDNDDEQIRICDTREGVLGVVNLARIDEVEDLHEHKDVEAVSEMQRICIFGVFIFSVESQARLDCVVAKDLFSSLEGV